MAASLGRKERYLGCMSERSFLNARYRTHGAILFQAAVIAIFFLAPPPAEGFSLFGTREVTVQFATQDGKPLADAEVRVFGPGQPRPPRLTGRTDSEGKFVFEADDEGFWSAEAHGADQVARLMIRVGGDAQQQSRFSPFLLIGILAVLLGVAIWYRLLRARRTRR
jgi:hypothetical protein